MKITSLLSNLILEQSRFQVLFDKMVKPSAKATEKSTKAKGLMDFDTLKNIIFADPTTKAPENFDVQGASVEDMDKVKVGKYSQWLLKNFVSPKPNELELNPDQEVDYNSREFKNAIAEFRRLFMEDLYKTTDDLKKFERAKPYLPQDQRDINKFTPRSLFDTLKDFQIPEKKRAELEKKEAKKSREGFNHAGGEIIYEGPTWTLIRVKDQGQVGKDAAIWYGGFHEYDQGESRWCTSSPGLTYFNGYIKDGPLYVVFPNDDKGQVGKKTGLPMERFQFHFPSNQFMDRHDRQINLVEYLNGPMSELKEFFKPEFAKGLVNKGGNKVEINYPDSSAGKFVALYGFDELFESLPVDIEHLLINNKSKEDIALDVPESLGRFTSLQALLLQNIVRSLPESIGKLQNLNFLALPSNKQLQNLPSGIGQIPGLAFINLKDSNPNVKIPNDLREKLSDEGNGFYYVN
jgi:Leucine-rich repeat (LRR) protein